MRKGVAPVGACSNNCGKKVIFSSIVVGGPGRGLPGSCPYVGVDVVAEPGRRQESETS